MKIAAVVIRTLIQWTWGILQNIAGLAVFLVNIRRNHYIYKGCIVTEWGSRDMSMGLGMFIFLGQSSINDEDVRAHEFGHTIQSMILGPFFVFVIAFPSLFWANSRRMEKYRGQKGVDYYRFYPERWANHIAVRKLGRCPGKDSGRA
ncbi:MAG: hypothetical protein K6G45_11625 [Lachnospiraceae bacterium]|nr:hypothetical protein [Lachnospiraceae bacterium]